MAASHRSLRPAALLASACLCASAALAQQLHLTGAQEVPANASTAVATGQLSVDDDGNVSGSVSAPTLTARTVEIRAGAPGMNGPVVLALTGGDPGTWTVPDGTKFTPGQVAAYKAGSFYIDIHTDAHPAGEIRTQLKP